MKEKERDLLEILFGSEIAEAKKQIDEQVKAAVLLHYCVLSVSLLLRIVDKDASEKIIQIVLKTSLDEINSQSDDHVNFLFVDKDDYRSAAEKAVETLREMTHLIDGIRPDDEDEDDVPF